ncbi:MAG: prolipoprotein diacylglyceryl transferase [Polyangiaceae bacterium]
MQPVLLHLRWFVQPTSVAWVYGACAVAALAFSFAVWRRRGLDLQRLLPWVIAALVLGVLAGVRRGQALPATELVVTSSGASLVLAAVSAWILTLGLVQRSGGSVARASSAFFLAALAGLLSARWMYLLANPEAVVHWASWLSVRGGGLLGYPGLLVGLGVGAWWMARAPEQRAGSVAARQWLDAAAPAAALGASVVRVGCYLFGCDYGRVLPEDSAALLSSLGTFPHWQAQTLEGWGAPAWVAQVNGGLLSDTSRESLPVHPTELYEAVLGVLLFGLLVWVRPRCKRPGQVFGVFVLGYAWLRFSCDLLRGDGERGLLGPALEGRLLLGLGWIVWGLLAGFAAAQLVRDARWRSSLRVALLLPGLSMLVVRVGRHPWDALTISLTQWLALLSTAACAVGFQWLERQPSSTKERPADVVEPS